MSLTDFNKRSQIWLLLTRHVILEKSKFARDCANFADRPIRNNGYDYACGHEYMNPFLKRCSVNQCGLSCRQEKSANMYLFIDDEITY